MAKQVYWPSDAEWKRIEPLLPRGRRVAHRVDDRRVISDIVHVLGCGARWRDCPEVYGPYTTIYIASIAGAVRGFGPISSMPRQGPPACTERLRSIDLHQGASLGGRGKRGAFDNAIGRSRGGQTTKIHALTDQIGRPCALLITAGNVHDLEGETAAGDDMANHQPTFTCIAAAEKHMAQLRAILDLHLDQAAGDRSHSTATWKARGGSAAKERRAISLSPGLCGQSLSRCSDCNFPDAVGLRFLASVPTSSRTLTLEARLIARRGVPA
ncbi:transposase [Bradyrhizobium sp. GM24.11]